MEEQAEKKYLRLSDAFQKPMENPDLELTVTMLNINFGKNRELLNQCQTLKEYAIYVEKVRSYTRIMHNVKEAVDKAVTECINEGILREFLLRNRKEAVEMSIFEYDEEAVLEILRKDEYEKGLQEGRKALADAVLELLEDLDAVPDDIREKILNEQDVEVLKRWNKLAAKAKSVDEFVEKM